MTATFSNDGLVENCSHSTSMPHQVEVTSNASQFRVMNTFGRDFEHVKEEERKRARILAYLDQLSLCLYGRLCSTYERSQAFAVAWRVDHE
jgi:hypothetical protein